LKEKDVIEEYSVGPASLEDVYLNVVGQGNTLVSTEKEADRERIGA
jgi:hypothetical protein